MSHKTFAWNRNIHVCTDSAGEGKEHRWCKSRFFTEKLAVGRAENRSNKEVQTFSLEIAKAGSSQTHPTCKAALNKPRTLIRV